MTSKAGRTGVDGQELGAGDNLEWQTKEMTSAIASPFLRGSRTGVAVI
jgi:hypothetical protein